MAIVLQAFAALRGNTPPDAVVRYCGSGVSACHNLLAMEIAGLSGSPAVPRLLERVVQRSGPPDRKRLKQLRRKG